MNWLFDHLCRPEQAKRDPGPITTNVCVARGWGRSFVHSSHQWLWVPAHRAQLRTRRGRQRGQTYPSSTASAPFTASALSVTVFFSEAACTEMFSAKNLASVT